MRHALAIALVLVVRAAHANVTYYGGPVVSSVKAVAVYWGPNVNSSVRSAVPSFFTDVLASSYIDLLAEYDTVGLTGQDGQPGSNQRIARGSFGGEAMITPSTTATSLTNTQVESELVAQVAAGHIPPPELDALGNANTIYFVFFPQGTSITFQGTNTSCQQWCAVHITVTINGHTVPYAMIPDMAPGSSCNGGCGTNANFVDNVTMYLGHEIGNVVTDPGISLTQTNVGRPQAWIDPQMGEIGSLCNQQSGTVAGHTVQKLWSNRQAACVLACTGASCPVPVDAAVPDAAIPDAGATGGAGGSSGAGGSGGSAGTGGSGGSSANGGGGGCGCDVAARAPSSPWLLMLIAGMIALRRRARAR